MTRTVRYSLIIALWTFFMVLTLTSERANQHMPMAALSAIMIVFHIVLLIKERHRLKMDSNEAAKK